MKSLYKTSSNYHRLLIVFLPVSTSVKGILNHGKLIFRINKLYAPPHQLTIRNKHSATNLHVLGAKGRNGFTLVELIVTVTVLAIIVAIAMPSILTQLTRMEARRVKTQLQNTLALAKAESYITRQDVLVCLSNNGRRCNRNADKTLLAFVDTNDNKRFDARVDTLLTQEQLNLKYSTLKLRVGSRRHYTKFWGDSGKPRGHFGHIKYCPTSSYNESMYQISFNQAGIVKYKLNSDHPTDC
ncbi:GspH/FimT family pseudopilin [Psychrobacter piscatorii]|uniref:GspH/FimT family pseudopilin n=1 Tax=Psychrobacter piscatorii TaxID=554343 RepID=UPI003736CCDA